jgi:hypothetical protein
MLIEGINYSPYAYKVKNSSYKSIQINVENILKELAFRKVISIFEHDGGEQYQKDDITNKLLSSIAHIGIRAVAEKICAKKQD